MTNREEHGLKPVPLQGLAAGNRRYLGWATRKWPLLGRSGPPPFLRQGKQKAALHKLGEDVYTFCTRSPLQGACEERRKERKMFIARMVAVL